MIMAVQKTDGGTDDPCDRPYYVLDDAGLPGDGRTDGRIRGCVRPPL
jgi:hypothetical protein